MAKQRSKEDWADRAAERFYITHTKFCQGPNADTESVFKWLRALAEKFRSLRHEREGRRK